MSAFRKSAYNLTEREIRWAISMSTNNAEAAQMLHVSYGVFRSYAKMYFDPETGGNLYDILKGAKKRAYRRQQSETLVEDILTGKKRWMRPNLVSEILIRECAMLEQCVYCGESERRITDGKSVCMLVWKNGDNNDHRRENLEMVCYNHFHLYYGDLRSYGYYKAHHGELLSKNKNKNV